MLGREWPPIQAADALRVCRGRRAAAAQMSFLSMPDSAELRASRMRSARPEAWELADCDLAAAALTAGELVALNCALIPSAARVLACGWGSTRCELAEAVDGVAPYGSALARRRRKGAGGLRPSTVSPMGVPGSGTSAESTSMSFAKLRRWPFR